MSKFTETWRNQKLQEYENEIKDIKSEQEFSKMHQKGALLVNRFVNKELNEKYFFNQEYVKIQKEQQQRLKQFFGSSEKIQSFDKSTLKSIFRELKESDYQFQYENQNQQNQNQQQYMSQQNEQEKNQKQKKQKQNQNQGSQNMNQNQKQKLNNISNNNNQNGIQTFHRQLKQKSMEKIFEVYFYFFEFYMSFDGLGLGLGLRNEIIYEIFQQRKLFILENGIPFSQKMIVNCVKILNFLDKKEEVLEFLENQVSQSESKLKFIKEEIQDFIQTNLKQFGQNFLEEKVKNLNQKIDQDIQDFNFKRALKSCYTLFMYVDQDKKTDFYRINDIAGSLCSELGLFSSSLQFFNRNFLIYPNNYWNIIKIWRIQQILLDFNKYIHDNQQLCVSDQKVVTELGKMKKIVKNMNNQAYKYYSSKFSIFNAQQQQKLYHQFSNQQEQEDKKKEKKMKRREKIIRQQLQKIEIQQQYLNQNQNQQQNQTENSLNYNIIKVGYLYELSLILSEKNENQQAELILKQCLKLDRNFLMGYLLLSQIVIQSQNEQAVKISNSLLIQALNLGLKQQKNSKNQQSNENNQIKQNKENIENKEIFDQWENLLNFQQKTQNEKEKNLFPFFGKNLYNKVDLFQKSYQYGENVNFIWFRFASEFQKRGMKKEVYQSLEKIEQLEFLKILLKFEQQRIQNQSKNLQQIQEKNETGEFDLNQQQQIQKWLILEQNFGEEIYYIFESEDSQFMLLKGIKRAILLMKVKNRFLSKKKQIFYQIKAVQEQRVLPRLKILQNSDFFDFLL
ncbi:hypothetical protein PPERSA_02061 [Pseudocohnilembus persalinus]|uniref:Uncharacterized protein n=1 Tax=Pseudocohnilembus persalinus TaxID=266149 RepID=A0A0V0QF98_PSEPJ|nr:hypothetical protein PPERSA_02061 [Pseudocohnilembus persalinus]|eukprot:KRX00882.1 hypothetical protein PPERSA_02061 [Pseudocohnilembus persalinus]